ncbi:MAG: filamentous hemagglutinin N-terminal domain-containing protein [Polaromonas sp.]
MSSHTSMNRIYRLVFNAATGMYVAVAETAKGRGKAGRSASAAMLAALTAIGGLSGVGGAYAQGLPTGGVAVTNNVSFSQTSNTLTMNQSGNAAIVNWNGFSIAAGNSVNINQQSTSAVMLNRVVGNSISEINGAINAIGKVMLVNQNGILMGTGAQVNTGGFLASTLNIKDSDFLAGKYIFDIANNEGGTAGSIINNGRINTPSGYAVLIAPQVTNNGFIAARQGTVAMGAGNKVSLDMVGDGLISLKVDQAALNAAVVNTGTIQANGGTVLLKASSANALFDTVINSSGIIRADSIANVNGRIVLDGGAKGITEVTGEITARGINAGETGGSISVLGDKVGLLGNGVSGAKLDASGDAGGGTVLVGGNWQGNGAERNASRTIVASNASIDVSATGNGNGGTAVVWADGRTDMSGTIKATGGINGGNGGNVETSGKAALDLQGRVDVTANNGLGGQWLLDPADIIIAGANGNLASAGPTFQDGGGGTAYVAAGALNAALGGGGATVNVQTSNTGGGGTGAITVNNAITASGSGTLNLIANGEITVNAPIIGGGLNVGLYAGSNGTPATIAGAGNQAGAITTTGAGTINTSGGSVIMVAGASSNATLVH